MGISRHTMTRAAFETLAQGGGGGTAVRLLVAAERSKHLLLIREIMAAAQASGHQLAGTAAAYELLARVHRQAPGAAETVIRYPAVGAWALRTLQQLRVGAADPAQPGWLAAIAASAAIRGRVSCAIEVPLEPGRADSVLLPSLGRAMLGDPQPSRLALVRSTADGAWIVGAATSVKVPDDPHTDAAGWGGLRRIRASVCGRSLEILLDDQEPHRFPRHPAAHARLASAQADAWQHAVRDGWEILACHHREIAAEVSAAITVFTPLGAPVRGQVSATARETFGCVALSAPSDGSSLAVTLAHEVQHAKLTALMDLFPLIWPGTDVRGYAPWQPEPRPLDALLHGAYAYVGVTRFWRRQRQLERHPSAALHAHTEFARWRVAARDVTVSLLGSGRLMPHGRLLAMGMLRSLNQWCRDDVPADALLAAARTAKRHKDQWLRRHGPLL